MITTEPKITTLKDAVQRLQWRFKSGKEFKPNDNDAQALNVIGRTLNQNAEKAVQENRLFAKLYLVLMADFARHYKSVDLANQQINRLFQDSVYVLCQKLARELNMIELLRLTEEKGIKGIADLKNKEEIKLTVKADREKYKNINIDELLETAETWDVDAVIANFQTTFNQSINNFKNLP